MPVHAAPQPVKVGDHGCAVVPSATASWCPTAALQDHDRTPVRRHAAPTASEISGLLDRADGAGVLGARGPNQGFRA
jgi:hypothetical protein